MVKACSKSPTRSASATNPSPTNCGQIKASLGVKRTAELIRFAVLTQDLSD
jgi:hypothetical protein